MSAASPVDCVEASTAWEDSLVRSNFSSTLDEKVKLFQSENRNAVWLKLSGDAGSLVSIARQHCFSYHHCKDDYIMLTRWLPADVPNKIPAYGTHQVGVGGLVLDKDNRILLVKERGGLPGVNWKLPGGLTDSGEDFGDAACREASGLDDSGSHVVPSPNDSAARRSNTGARAQTIASDHWHANNSI